MATGINKVILIGRLGNDPDVRYTVNGTAVANVSLATTESWTKDGNKQERTEWHRVVFFSRLAEIVGEYLKKGSLIYVEGRLQTREWEDKSGNKRYTTEIVSSGMQMLGSSGNVSTSDSDMPSTANAPAATPAATQKETKRDLPNVAEDEFDDDIPF